jgi:hypothetical protein
MLLRFLMVSLTLPKQQRSCIEATGFFAAFALTVIFFYRFLPKNDMSSPQTT